MKRRYLLGSALAALMIAALALLAHAQGFNGAQIANWNMNGTIPASDSGYTACQPKTSALNVILECPSAQGSVDAVAYSTTPALNPALGSVQQFACTTAGASISPTLTGLSAGQQFVFVFVQNGTTACTVTYPSDMHSATTVSSTLSSVSVQRFVVSANGTDAYGEGAGSACTSSCGTP